MTAGEGTHHRVTHRRGAAAHWLVCDLPRAAVAHLRRGSAYPHLGKQTTLPWAWEAGNTFPTQTGKKQT